jgi:NAD(P)-dependent dehydrogenase (short-subunit alcohol dehydrogenase family)
VDEWRRQFEVNFFGHIAVTQAMLPLLRVFASAKAGPLPARIVMMSSIAGRIGQPILGPYCSSKSALEAMSDALRLELHRQGIGVSLVEPGAIKSDIWRKGQEEAAAKDLGDPMAAPYRELVRGITLAAARAESAAIPSAAVARVVERCLTAGRPPIRVLVGRDAKLAAAAKAVVPLRFIDGLIRLGLRRIASKDAGT